MNISSFNMDYMHVHALNVDDANFYKLVLSDLISVETRLKPILHETLKIKEKSQKLRTSLSTLCGPKIIDFKRILENQQVTNVTELEELKTLKKPLEEIMYQKLMIPTSRSD